MAEQTEENTSASQAAGFPEVAPGPGARTDTPQPHAAYFKFLDYARKTAAIGVVLCGPAWILCVRRDDYLTETLRRESGVWGWGVWLFGIGVCASLMLTVLLIVEHLARPAAPRCFTLRSVLLRSLLILIAGSGICLWMVVGYGVVQGVGAVLGIILALAAMRTHGTSRAVLAVCAAILLGLTLLSTQSAYQYARRHADEIVAEGCNLMDRSPGVQSISSDDPRVPVVFRRLGAQSVIVNEDRVAVYVPGLRRAEFHIYRVPSRTIEPVWITTRGKGAGHLPITDRLWMITDD
jgi:hypothetical protein